MAAGSAAAASVGFRRGTLAGQAIARNRAALAMALETPEDIFLNIFKKSKGASTLERLTNSFPTFARTGLGRKIKIKALERDEIEFMLKMSDRAGGRADNKISEEEARFAFRVWVSFGKMHAQVQDMFARFDVDRNGCLDEEELHAYLVELNEGCQVSRAEVKYVMQFVDLDRDGSLDKRELVLGTCVWYCDVNYAENYDCNDPRSSCNRISSPNAKLKVIFIGCFNLRNADGWATGLSDPFCVCAIAGRPDTTLKTPTLPDELNPTWNYTGFIYDLRVDDVLEFTVFDEDFMKPPNRLGHASFAFNEYYPDGFIGSKILTDAGSAQGKASIHLRIIVLEPVVRSDPHNLEEWQAGCAEQTHEAPVTIANAEQVACKTPEALAYPDAPDICQPLASGPDVAPLMSWW